MNQMSGSACGHAQCEEVGKDADDGALVQRDSGSHCPLTHRNQSAHRAQNGMPKIVFREKKEEFHINYIRRVAAMGIKGLTKLINDLAPR